jgi:peptidoglycan/xylan/chitin deacetylase (PgdA/CDA1 family)
MLCWPQFLWRTVNYMRGLVVLILLATSGACAGDRVPEGLTQPAREIAITFDDATLPDGPLLDGGERTRRLVAALDAAGVGEAMFFVTTGNVEREAGAERIRSYAAAGHALANHSHSHEWLHKTDTEAYIADIDRAIVRLSKFDGVEPYYRFPFLDEGHEMAKRDRLREALGARGLRNGYVTVDTWDWYLVDLAQEAKTAGVAIDLDKLGDLYVDVITRSTLYYDAMAVRVLGRSPKHVLLLHENDLAALFIDDLVATLEARGFRIIPATEAFTDPIAAREPDTLYLGQGRVAALAHEAGAEPDSLPSPTEDQAYLRRRFNDEVASLPESSRP